jgi:hypothetical protein
VVLGWIWGGPWLGFAAAFLIAVNLRRGEEAACVFGLWMVGCLVYNGVIIASCREWLRPGIRRRLGQ